MRCTVSAVRNVLGIGVDAVDIKRVREARQFERVSEYVLNTEEREHMYTSRDPIQFLASRLAIKEAVIKAHPVRLNLMDVFVKGYGAKPEAIVRHPEGEGYLIDVGLTHTPELAIGIALVTKA